MSRPDIFISYNREDSAVAQVYRDALAQEGFEVWWDQALDSGETYDEVTEAALRSAKAVVVLWSPRSVASRWVRAEATIADRNGTMVPVMIELCERPVMFELTQTADLSRWKGDPEDGGWRSFLDAVRRKAGRDAQTLVDQPVSNSANPTETERSVPALVGLLPISCRGDDGELEFLAEDLADDLVSELTLNGWFKMVAARKMAGYCSKAIDYLDLGRELDASYLIDGKLQRTGEKVRLIMQIVDAATGSVLHTHRVNPGFDDISESIEDFAVSLADDLGEKIIQFEVDRAVAKATGRSGWEYLLLAKAGESTGGSEAMRTTQEACQAAVTIEPGLGMAHAMLAYSYAILVAAHGLKMTDEMRQEMRSHAARAQSLDRNNPAVLDYLIVTYAALYDEEASLVLAKRLVQVLPRSPKAHHRLLISLVSLGRTTEAIAAYQDYVRVALAHNQWPVAHIYGGMCYYLEGQLPEAQAALDLALGLFPGFFLGVKWKAIVAGAAGDEQTGIAMISRLRDLEPEMTLDMHVQQILQNPRLAEPSAEAVEILRRLWAATDA